MKTKTRKKIRDYIGTFDLDRGTNRYKGIENRKPIVISEKESLEGKKRSFIFNIPRSNIFRLM